MISCLNIEYIHITLIVFVRYLKTVSLLLRAMFHCYRRENIFIPSSQGKKDSKLVIKTVFTPG